MPYLVRRFCLPFLAVALVVGAARALAATPAAETLLPASTRAYVSLPNTPDAIDLWAKSPMGRMLDDPQMVPFVEDLRSQLEKKWRDENTRLGFKWDGLKPAVSGELSFAIVHDEGKQMGLVMLADVTGREAQARELLAGVDAVMQQKKAKRTNQTVAGVAVTIYDEPRKADDPPNQVRRSCYFLANNALLGTTNQLEIATAVLTRLGGQKLETLSDVPAFQTVLARVAEKSDKKSPQARWWADPIGTLAAGQAGVPADKRRDPDMLKIARNVGFGAVKGIGGTIQLGGTHHLLARTFVLAPKPWTKSMNMLTFPNGGNFKPQEWAPADVASYTSFNLDIQTAEAHFEPLFDSLFGDGETGVWSDVKESFRDDPNGPGIDIQKDLVAHLGQRVTMLSDYTSPTTLDCERNVMAIEVKNSAALAETIRKAMEPDPNVRKVEFEGHVIWEMLEETVEAPMVELELPGQAGKPADKRGQLEAEVAAGGDRLLPRSSVTVARGHLFVASSIPLLKKVLTPRPAGDSLAAAPEYVLVQAEAARLHTGPQSFSFFTRVDDVVRPHFDLVKRNQMPQAKTSLANGINRIFNGGNDRTKIRPPQIDGTKLPDFETVRKYFGLGGGVLVTENDGWSMINFTIDPTAAQPAAAGQAAAAPQP